MLYTKRYSPRIMRYIQAAYTKKNRAPIPKPVVIKQGDVSKSYSLDGITPRRLIIKKSTLTLKKWLRKGPRSRLKNAQRDQVTIVKLTTSKRNPNLILSETRTMEQTGKKVKVRYWKHRLLRLEPQKSFTESCVKFTCSCPDWWATWEYVAEKHGNTDMINGNGEPPEIRNPQQYHGLCKHGIVLFKTIMDKEKVRKL